MYEDAVAERDLADIGAATAVHRETVAALAHDLDGTVGRACLLAEQSGQARGVRGAHGDARTQPGACELGGVLVGDEPAPLQRDDPVGGACGFLGVGRGQQDRSTLGRVCAQRAVQPAALAGREPLRGVVEHERVRVGEERAGQAEAAVHAAREGAEAFVAQADEADHLQNLVSTPGRYARRGAQHAQMTAHRARRMPGNVTQKHADLARRMRHAMQGAASEEGDATALLEFEHESERRRLARSCPSEQRGDTARLSLEGHVVEGGGNSLRGLLVSPIAWITRSKIARYVRFFR